MRMMQAQEAVGRIKVLETTLWNIFEADYMNNYTF